MSIKGSALLLTALVALGASSLCAQTTFYGGPINDILGEGTSTATATGAANMQNLLNNTISPIIKSGTTSVGLTADNWGPAIAQALAMLPGPQLQSQILALQQTLTAARAGLPENRTGIVDALQRQVQMLQREQAFYVALQSYAAKSATPMTFQDRINLQTQLATLTTQIATDAAQQKGMSNAARLAAEAAKTTLESAADNRRQAESAYTR